MARPRKNVDPLRVIELASKGLSIDEIGAFCDVSHDTITRRFADALEKGRQLCNASLRRKQVEMALEGNATMLVWLGKNRLDQTDVTRQEITGRDGSDIVVHVRYDEPICLPKDTNSPPNS